MHESSIGRRHASKGLGRIVSRVMLLSVAGFGLAACVTHDPDYRAHRHYGYGYGSGSHVMVAQHRPDVVYRTHRAAPRPHRPAKRVVVPHPRPHVHIVPPRRPPHVRGHTPPRPHARPPARPGHHARPGAVHRPGGHDASTRPPHARPARPGSHAGQGPARRPDARPGHGRGSQAGPGRASAPRPAVRRDASGRTGARGSRR